jgi:hypothetical protein
MESAEQIIRLNNLSKELRKYGFAQSSQEAISQAGTIVGSKAELSPQVEMAQLTREQMTELVTKMQRLWTHKDASEQKVAVIADQLVKVTDKLNEIIKSLSLVEMNQAIFDKKLNVLKEKAGNPDFREAESKQDAKQQPYIQEQRTESSTREKETKKLDRPIDRNGVAPADVSIEKMFYFGNKK